MATCRKRGDSWEFIVKRKALLPKPVYLTFADKAEGEAYVARLEKLLARGIVPAELATRELSTKTLRDAIRAYLTTVSVPTSDADLLNVLIGRIGTTRLTTIDYLWAEKWVQEMKRVEHLKPGTIRHYVGALSRCLDWVARRGTTDLLVGNVLHLLPHRYATYTDADAAAAEAKIEDTERDRRLEAAEEKNVRLVLDGQRPKEKVALELRYQAALEFLFELAIESAMRMREMYTLAPAQLDVRRKTAFLDNTNTGSKRQVPLSPDALAAYKVYAAHVKAGTRGMEGFSFDTGRIFPWWDGETTPKSLKSTTALISRQFARVFAAAGCPDETFHDLRHEATSRLFELTDLSDLEIAKITGHKDLRSLARYTNLRGSKLAERLGQRSKSRRGAAKGEVAV